MRAHLGFAASAVLALGLVSSARAGNELYLRWDDCLGNGGTYNKVFACDTNLGEAVLVGSFRLAATTQAVTGLSAIVNFTSVGAAIPAWWDLRNVAGACRRGALVSEFTAPPTSTGCAYPWATPSGGAAGGHSYDYPDVYPDRARVRLTMAIPAGEEFTVPAGQETFAFRLHMDRRFTTGPACAGCLEPVCIGWGWALITTAPGSGGTNFLVLGSETPDNGSNVTWQPGAVATTFSFCPPFRSCESYMICQSATPAQAPTWGAIKSLYR